LLQQAIAALNAVSATVESFRAEAQRLAQLLPEYPVVMAMYGVGDSLGPKLIAEIGDVRRFAGKRALVAYAGIDPEPSQSGKRNTKSNSISRKGVPEIRKAVFLVMECLLKKAPADEPVYQFLDKKRSEGKPYFVYMTAASNKFLRI
jgi:transposase